MFHDQASTDMVTFSITFRFEPILKNSYSYSQAKKTRLRPKEREKELKQLEQVQILISEVWADEAGS